MTYKQIETSREIRQWVGLAATAVLAATALDKAYPDMKIKAKRFGNNLKNKAVNLFKKEREK